MIRKKRVFVTGYGPFRRCDVNPSAVIVERLSKVRMDGVDLQTEVIPVAYSEAIKCSKRLCQDVKPDFIVHLGVSGEWEDCIQLELQSFSHGYWLSDIEGKVPYMNCSPTDVHSECPRILKTRLNCEVITKALCDKYPDLCIETSDDPGRYLCAFIYCLSLAQYDGRALFIHVPNFNGDAATPEQLTNAVRDIIEEIAKQL